MTLPPLHFAQTPLESPEWTNTVQSELLDGLIKDGGSAVRFVAADDATLDSIAIDVAAEAEDKGYHVVIANANRLREDGKKPDFHLMHKLFFHIAETIDWAKESRAGLEKELANRGIRLPATGLTNDYLSVAKLNEVDPADLLNDYKKLVTHAIMRDYGMAKEFRIALAALGRAQLIPEEITPTTEEVLLHWFYGISEPGSLAVLREIRIFERINRSNARFMLRSLAHWLPSTGKTGTVLIFDFRAYERVKRSRREIQLEREMYLSQLAISGKGIAADELSAIMSNPDVDDDDVYYGPSAYIQALEMLRHMIDNIEQLDNFLFIVLGTPRFFDDRPKNSNAERRFTDYNALQTRIGLEVRDINRQNPSASLVHVGADQEV